jgi:Protein of unknown function (DUF3175)
MGTKTAACRMEVQNESFDKKQSERQKTMERRCDYEFNKAARGTLHQECRRDRAKSRLKKSFPQGSGSGLRMLTFYINRAGKELTDSRRTELEKAKDMLSDRIRQ